MGHCRRCLEFWCYCKFTASRTIYLREANVYQLINLIWGVNFHIFEPEEPEDHEMYETKIVVRQHQWFGPCPISYKDIADEDTQEAILGIMSAVPPDKMKPFRYLSEREICDEDKAFILGIMQLNPRDRPTAKELLQHKRFTERSERTVGGIRGRSGSRCISRWQVRTSTFDLLKYRNCKSSFIKQSVYIWYCDTR
jgi:serine/threonine protein kinase